VTARPGAPRSAASACTHPGPGTGDTETSPRIRRGDGDAEPSKRLEGADVHVTTTPLLTTASGQKMGKTEAGALYLDPERTEYVDNGFLLALDERFPQPPLLSSDPSVASRQRALEDWVDESFVWYWNQWRRMREDQAEYAAKRAAYRFSWLQPRTW